MDRHAVIKKSEAVLRKVYRGYQSRGMVALYLWGSVTGDDFRYGASDIDSIAIVKNSLSLKQEEIIKESLGRVIRGVSIRFLYVSELNGKKVKGNLANFIHPRLLLLDLPYWRHVAGRKFKKDDFALEDADADSAIRLTMAQIYRRNLPEIKKQNGKGRYFIKALARLCYYLQLQDRPSCPFSYTGLLKTNDKKMKQVVKSLLKVKKGQWNPELFEREFPRYVIFLESTRKSLLAGI